ncbi:MAG: hypothetical protein LAT51_03260 [Flavobacteriaceae bacterium]|nr:hypothetical protein [Flavobacteriaceae bacterium]
MKDIIIQLEKLLQPNKEEALLQALQLKNKYFKSNAKMIWLTSDLDFFNATKLNQQDNAKELIEDPTIKELAEVVERLNQTKLNEISESKEEAIHYPIFIASIVDQALENEEAKEKHIKTSLDILVEILSSQPPEIVLLMGKHEALKSELQLNQFNYFDTCKATSKGNTIFVEVDFHAEEKSTWSTSNDILKAVIKFRNQIQKWSEKAYSIEAYQTDTNQLKSDFTKLQKQILQIKCKLVSHKQFEVASKLKDLEDDLKRINDKLNKLKQK